MGTRKVLLGTGSFSRTYLRHEPLPAHLADKYRKDDLQVLHEGKLLEVEEQNLNQPGHPGKRIKKADVEKAFKDAGKKGGPSKKHH